jgi:hypothetical protein
VQSAEAELRGLSHVGSADHAVRSYGIQEEPWKRYKQTRSTLKGKISFDGPTGYCCLGVLCDISGQGEWEGGGYVTSGVGLSFGYLPDEVQEWAGLATNDPAIGDRQADALSYKNDSGATFAEIADLIEQNF